MLDFPAFSSFWPTHECTRLAFRGTEWGTEFRRRSRSGMARQSEGPWFRKSKNTWYVTAGGKKISLGVQGERNRPDAIRAWHRFMAGESVQTTPVPPKATWNADKPPTTSVRLQAVIDGFLVDAPGRMTPACLRNYRCFLEPFARKHGERQAEELTPQEAEGYARKPEWSSTYRANFLTAVGAVYRWALRERLLTTNPMACLRKPVRESRGISALLSSDDYGKLIRHANPTRKTCSSCCGTPGQGRRKSAV
jgi:hypothetical protein